MRGKRRTLDQPDAGEPHASRKREHSRKPDELYPIIEDCSPGPRLELFARYPRDGWDVWGNEAAEDIEPHGRRHRGYGTERGPQVARTL